MNERPHEAQEEVEEGVVEEGKGAREGEEVAEPVFERSGESGGYTFTDLHYPGFAPTPSDTHP